MNENERINGWKAFHDRCYRRHGFIRNHRSNHPRYLVIDTLVIVLSFLGGLCFDSFIDERHR